MRTVFQRLSTLTSGMVLLAGSLACTVESTDDGVGVKSNKNWIGDTEEFTEGYEAGKNVKVVNGNGDIRVRRTERTDIRATFEPFVGLAYDTCGEDDWCDEVDEELEKIEFIVREEDGNWLIQARRDDGKASLGAKVFVDLPASFDGRLTVAQNNGQTDIEPMGNAAAVIVESQNGSCDINTGSAPEIDIRCKNGSTDVVIGEVVPGNQLRQIYKADDDDGVGGDLGDLFVQFPNTSEPFSVQALSQESAVDLQPASPSGCNVASEDPRSVTVSCNGATDQSPTYSVTSTRALVDVTVAF